MATEQKDKGSGLLTSEEYFDALKPQTSIHQQLEQKLADEQGFFGTVGDAVKGAAHGITDAADETLQFGIGAVDKTLEVTGAAWGMATDTEQDWGIDDDSYMGEEFFFSKLVPRPVTGTGKFVEDIFQFGAGMIGVGKFRMAQKASLGLKGAKLLDTGKDASKLKKFVVGGVDSAVASAIVMDPYEDTLAEFVQNSPEYKNDLTAYLANDINDEVWEMRLKNMGEDVLFSAVFFATARLVKNFRKGDDVIPTPKDAPDTPKATTTDTTPKEGPPTRGESASQSRKAKQREAAAKINGESGNPRQAFVADMERFGGGNVDELIENYQKATKASRNVEKHVKNLPEEEQTKAQIWFNAGQDVKQVIKDLPSLSDEAILSLATGLSRRAKTGKGLSEEQVTEALASAGNKMSRGDRKALDAQIKDLEYKKSQLDVEGPVTIDPSLPPQKNAHKQSRKNAQRQKRADEATSRVSIQADVDKLDELLEGLYKQRDGDEVARGHEALLSRHTTDKLEKALYLRKAKGATKEQKQAAEEVLEDVYKELGERIEVDVVETTADVAEDMATLKTPTKKKKPTKKPEETKKAEEPKKSEATSEGIPSGVKSTTDNTKVEANTLELSEVELKSLHDELAAVEIPEGKLLLDKYTEILKDRTRGLSQKYWRIGKAGDQAVAEGQMIEYLQAKVLNPFLKSLQVKAGKDTQTFEDLHRNLTVRLAENQGLSSEQIAAKVMEGADNVYEATLELMTLELRINTEWDQMMKVMNNPERTTGMPGMQEKLTAEFLLRLKKVAELTDSAGSMETAVARSQSARRMALGSVESMDSKTLKRVLDSVPGRNTDVKGEALETLVKNLNLANGDVKRAAKIARDFHAYKGVEKFVASMTEIWRGALLMSSSTNATNLLMGTLETFIVPVERLIGSHPLNFNMSVIDGQLAWDPAAKQAHDEAWLHIRNLAEGFKHSFAATKYAFKTERGILDPYKGAMIELPGKGYAELTHAEMMARSPMQVTAANWGLDGETTLGKAVNYLGQGFRMSFRFLGAQDEMLKQTTYFANLKSKYQAAAMKDINSGALTREQAGERVQKQIKDHFQDDGFTPKVGKDGKLATDEDALMMAQDVTHTKPAWEGTIVAGTQRAVNDNPILGLFLPFIRTPSDLINKAYQRTPLIGMFSKRWQKDFNSKNPVLRAQARGRQMVGTGVVVLGGLAVAEGRLTGKGPDDPRAKKIWLLTHQENSIKVEGVWYNYNKSDPLGLLLGVIANGTEAYRNGATTEGTDGGDLAKAMVMAVTATIGDKSALRGMINLTTLLSDQVIGKEEATDNILEDHVASWIPSMLMQTSRAFTDTSYVKEADGFIEKMMRKSPWHQQNLPDRYNWVTGKRDEIPTGHAWGIPMKDVDNDFVLKELGNVRHGFTGPTRTIKGVELTSQQFSDWNKYMGNIRLQGKNLKQALRHLMLSTEYDMDPGRVYFMDKAGDEPHQVVLIKRIIREYKAASKYQLLRENPELDSNDDNSFSLFGV